MLIFFIGLDGFSVYMYFYFFLSTFIIFYFISSSVCFFASMACSRTIFNLINFFCLSSGLSPERNIDKFDGGTPIRFAIYFFIKPLSLINEFQSCILNPLPLIFSYKKNYYYQKEELCLQNQYIMNLYLNSSFIIFYF